MSNIIFRPKSKPQREELSWKEMWEGPDKGLITCWEVGRKKRASQKELARKAENNELPVLGWKGGIDKAIQKTEKYGTLNYLAQWQGLRGEDLNIDTNLETELTCTRTGMKVIYTFNSSKYSEK